MSKSSFEDITKRVKRTLADRPPYPLKRKECSNCTHIDGDICYDCVKGNKWKVDEDVLAREYDEVMKIDSCEGCTHRTNTEFDYPAAQGCENEVGQCNGFDRYESGEIEAPSDSLAGVYRRNIQKMRPMADRVVEKLEKEHRMEDDIMNPTLSASEFLHTAVEIMEERGETYDSEGGERSMGKTVTAFNTITGQSLTESEGWLLLQLLKDVRQWSRDGYHADSAEDCIAYAALKAEALQEE